MDSQENLVYLQDQVKYYLEENGIMKKHLAKQIDVTPGMLSHWFAGRVTFPKKKILLIKSIISNN